MPSTDPIGVPGQPWGDQERDEWRSRQRRRRSYLDDVIAPLDRLSDRLEPMTYGRVVHGEDSYDLCALRSLVFDHSRPTALITGGVHGYETSGVLGALAFAEHVAGNYLGRLNLLIVPCVSPWAYERVHRWNYDAVDPNRNFRAQGPVEATALIDLVGRTAGDFLVHVDLHETTDSDRTEFGPALSARDGQVFVDQGIPDGFYLVADREDAQLEFQQAIINAVAKLTHIAAADAQGEIIGLPVIAHGIIDYPLADLGLCASITAARYRTTTEVYPDSRRTTADTCVRVQVAAVQAALDFALTHAGAASAARPRGVPRTE